MGRSTVSVNNTEKRNASRPGRTRSGPGDSFTRALTWNQVNLQVALKVKTKFRISTQVPAEIKSHYSADKSPGAIDAYVTPPDAYVTLTEVCDLICAKQFNTKPITVYNAAGCVKYDRKGS